MRAKFFQYFIVFATVFSGVFLWENTSAFTDITSNKTLLEKNISAFAATHVSPCQLINSPLPFESAPVHKDREIPSENEQEDDFDFDGNSLAEEVTLFSTFDFSVIENRVIPPSSSIHNRTAVPLFVLYHSWKSYLS